MLLIKVPEYYMTSVESLPSDCVLFLVFRFETLDLTSRLLIPIIVLQNHNRYNIMDKGHNYSINVEEIEREVCYLLWSRLIKSVTLELKIAWWC